MLATAIPSSAATYYYNRNSILTNDKNFTRSINWTANADGTGAYAPSTLDDDFTADALNTSVWTVIDRDGYASNPSPNPSTTTNSDQLTFSVRGADLWTTTNEYVAIYRSDIAGNFDVSVKVVSQSGASAWAKAGIMVTCDFNNVAGCGGYLILAVTPSHAVNLQWATDATPTPEDLDAGSAETGNSTLPKWLRLVKNGNIFTGYYKDTESAAWTQVGTTVAPYWVELDTEIGLFANSNNAAGTATWVMDDFKGGGPISATGHALSLAGTGANADANATVGFDADAASIDFSNYTGTLDMGGQRGLFATYYDNDDFTGTSVSRVDSTVNFNWGAGVPATGIGGDNFSVMWEGYLVAPVTGTYTFYTHDDDAARLWINGVKLVEDYYSSTTAEKTGSPTVALTAGQRVPIQYWMLEYGGDANARLRWQCSACSPAVPKEIIPKRALYAGRISVTGNANLSAGTFTAADGLIEFKGTSGTQVFTPRSGQTMARILHSGASTLQLSTNNLTSLGFFQGAGILDLNGLNLTTVAGGYNRGDLSIWNGTSTTISNLGGRTLTVAGNASFVGQSGNTLNLDPGSAWTLAVTGQLNARYASISNSNASVTPGIAYRSTAGSGNSNWTVGGTTTYWDRNFILSSSTDFSKAYNWASNANGTGIRPISTTDDWFDSASLGSAWTFKDQDGDESYGSYRVSGGQLILTGDGGDIWGATNEYSTLYRTDITGDFDVQVKLVSVNSPGGTGYKIGLIMADDMNTLGSGGYAKLNFHGTGKTEFSWDENTNVGEIESNSDGGVGLSLPIWLRLIKSGTSVTAWYKTTESGSWTQNGTAKTPQSTAANSHIALFVCAGAGTATAVFDHFQGGTTIATTDDDASFNGSGSGADANATLSAARTVKSIDFTNYSGTFNFGSYTLTISGGNATFTSTMGLTVGTGTLGFDAAWGVNSTLVPKSGATHPPILKTNANQVTVSTNPLITTTYTQNGGTWDWGSGMTHSVSSIATSAASQMTFNTSTVNVTTGNADFSGLTTVNANTGTVAFTGTTGTQILTPKSGQAHPTITHTGASTLQLATNDLSTLGFSQSAGVMDFNGRNLTTTSSGNLTVTNGSATTFTGLGGRTLTVAGNASFTGQSGNLLGLNPTTSWTMNATGSLSASYATIGNSNASGGSRGTATTSVDAGGNSNWNLNAFDYSAWNYSSRVQFNTTSTGANVSGNVSDFPMLVRLNANNFIFEQARSDGRDIRFADPDGTPLFYQIERWDATAKLAEVWVLVNQVDGNSDRDFMTLYWGNNAATSESNGPAVFSANHGFSGAWHLGEDGNTTAGGYADATGLGKAGTGTAMTSSSDVTGAVGMGQQLDGSTQYITVSGTYPSGTGVRTLCAWGKINNATGNMVLAGYGNTSGNAIFGLVNWSSNFFGGWADGAGDVTSTSSTNSQWHNLCFSYDGATTRFYVDGALNVSETVALTTNSGTMKFGARMADNAVKWKGIIDEIQVSSVQRSADWIKLAYATQAPNSTVLTLPNTALSNWSYSTKIYVNTTASGANITSNQSSYPLLVRLTPANFNFSQANSNGSDLRFADSAGTLLSYEIERYDATARAADIWVLIPTLKGNNSSQWFKMYWGRSTATSLSSGAAVFLGTAGFVGVWHLGDDGNTTASGYRDATSYENHGTGIAFDANTDLAAVVGKGGSFAVASNQGIHVANQASLYSAGSLTVQAWINQYSQAAYRRIVGKPFSSAASPWNEFDLELNDPGNRAVFSLTLGGVEAGYATTSTLSVGTWYNVAGVYDGSAQKVYLNGVMETTGARTGSISDYAQPLAIGKYYHSTGSNWDGILDEVRVSNVARSADWLKLDYETMKSGSTVVTVGNRTPDYSKSVQLNFNTTNSGGGANVSGNVANIPMLVRLSSTNLDFTAVRDDGSDIQFVDKGGAYLYHEVVEWDKGNRAGKVWVKVPQVDGNSTADFITLYYGCPTCTGSPYAVKDSVWSAYAGVYHLNGPEAKGYDATVNANHMSYRASIPVNAGLTTALSPSFSQTVGGYADAPDPANGSLDVGTGDFTVSMWIKTSQAAVASVWPYPVAKMGGSPAYGYDFFMGDGTGSNGGKTGFDIWSNGTNVNRWSTSAINNGAWHHVVGKKTATAVELYVDGVSQGTTAHSLGTLDNANTFAVGGNFSSSYLFAGNLNEVAMAKTAFSADYVKLSYENQKEGSTVLQTAITASSFTSSKVFKFNTTASGANVSGDVYDFPLLLRFTDATLIDATQSAGQDIRFLDGDGVTWLDFQIERWDQTNNVGEIWVKVPKVDGNSAGDFITMYYNDAAGLTLPAGQCGSCVFGTANGFQGVWHLNEDGNTSVNGYVDATSNGYHGQGVNIDNTDDVTGLAGLGQDLDGTNEYLTMTGTYPTGLNKRSLSIWGKADVAPVTAHKILANYGTGTANNNFGTYFSEATDAWTFFGWSGGDFGTGVSANTSWHHHFITYDGDSVRYYLDGAQIAVAQRTLGTPSSNLKIGARISDNAVTWDGIVDETRMANVVRSADWIKLEYQSQRNDATPLFNPSPADFVSSRKYVFNTTRTGANVMGDVENFPLLVRITGSTLVDAVQNDWDDIRFLDGDGKTWLPYQVERWSKAQDSAEVWVLVPKVDGNSDQDYVTLYYNDVSDGAVPNGQCGSCVFGSTVGFTGVWHMNDNAASATVTEAVSSLNGTFRSNTTNDNTSNHDDAGIIGGGLNFQGGAAGSGGGTQLDNFTHSLQWPKTTGSISHWVRPDQVRFMVTLYESNGTTTNSYNGFGGGDMLECHLGIAGTVYSLYYHDGNSVSVHPQGGTATAGAWAHVAATWDRNGTAYMYVNGVQAASATMSGLSWTSKTPTVSQFGRVGDGTDNRHWDGLADEIQVSSVQRSADWMKLAYETQRASGNLFWNSRPGPNNKAVLTATPGSGAISLSWGSTVSDSSNADSVGIWLKYSGTLDSVGATGQTKVVFLPKTDSAYSYPATYTGTYVFGLAVRNTSGQWSPFTAASTDTVLQSGDDGMTDTIYVDSAIGTASGGTAGSCTNARNPATPLAEIEDAVWCAQASGFSPNDTLVVRVLPGTYASSSDNELAVPSSYPVVVTSFDAGSRPVLGSATHSGYTVQLGSRMTLRRMDIRAATNGAAGIQIKDNADSVIVDGCRIYNNGNTKHDTGIVVASGSNEGVLLANNLIHQPNLYGVYVFSDDRTNIIGNTIAGSGGTGTKGIYMPRDAWNAGYFTITNNIFHNWDYGIHTTDANSEIGTVSNNLFHLITTNREVVGETDAAKIVADPRFYSIDPGHRHGFKILPGSPALEAGTSTINTLATESWPRVSYADHFGSTRPQGTALDIGYYEGSGYTPNPTGDFDTLINTVSGNTVIVRNSKWKLVWDMARGSGITGFYDMADSTTNLVATGSLLFDVRLDAYLASSQTSNTLAPDFRERTRARSVVRQRQPLSASLDLNVYYTVYASGHVYIQSEIANLSSGTLDVDAVQYNLKVASASAVTKSGGSLAGISYKNGFGYLTTSSRDPFLSVTQDLDTGAFGASETWTQVGSVAGSTDSVGFSIADMTDLARNMKRHHHFLLYVGESGMDFGKAATLDADARNPSPVSMSAGTLLHERSWQDRLGGHWTFDEGTGSSAKDKSINYTNNAALTSTTWVSGKVNGALRFTTSSVATVTDADVLEAGQNRTYMLWVKPDFAAMGADAFILSKGLTTASGWHFRRVSGQSKIKFVMANVEVQTPTLTTGVWTHLAASVGGPRDVTLFVNGVLAAAGTAGATTATNADNLLIGKSGADANAFAGDIDDVRIYQFNPPTGQLQAIVNRGFSIQYGQYHLRADNNNRVVALLNESVAQTRVQPAFEIDNWYGTKTPKYVYLNGARLIPNVDFVVDSLVYGGIGAFGNSLILQVNKVLTGTNQTLFVDDNDSSGYMGEASRMKALTVSATANDKIAIKNFADTVFGSASSGQWYMELDLNGWTTPTRATLTDTGFGEINVWKAAAVSPNLAVSSATQMVGWSYKTGRSLSYLKLDATSSPNETFTSGVGYASPANLTYTLTDSSTTRLSLTLGTISLSGEGSASVSKRFTFYPTGRVFVSYVISGATADFDIPRLDLNPRYNGGNTATAWAAATATGNARWAFIGGDLDYHSIGLAMLSVKNAASTYTTPGAMLSSTSPNSQFGAGNDQRMAQFILPPSAWTSANKPVTVNFMMDFSKDFTDSATADSLLKDSQTPAVITAITGTATTNDALDLNADAFAEGDGAYTYTASGTGVAHFKFVNTVTHFNPAFRIKSWSYALPEAVIVDNQTLNLGYQYNASVNFATSELVIQFNKTFSPGTHLFFLSHKGGLAVSLNHFEAVGGEGVDSLKWSTESEFENLGFNLYRRVAPVQDLPDSLFAGAEKTPGAGIANALLENIRVQAAAKPAADSATDTLPELSLSAEEIKALGYVRINAKLIPGAKGGSSATTQSYEFIDRAAGFGITYEYMLEAVDFSGARVQYGPRKAKPRNPLETALESNYPNPFNPITTLRFSLREKAKVSLVVYDAKGRLVRTLIRPDKPLLPGKYRLIWNAKDDRGFEVPSGQYFYRFTAPRYHKTRKMILVK